VNPDDLSNDTDPRFLDEFYKNLKILSQGLYRKEAQTTAQTQQISSGGANAVGGNTMVASNSRTALQTVAKSAFAKNKQSPMNRASFRGSMANNELSSAIAAANLSSEDDGGDGPSLHRVGSQQNVSHGQNVGHGPVPIEERIKQYLHGSAVPLEFFDRYNGGGATAVAAPESNNRRKSVVDVSSFENK
jgi:hypothetical protein